MTTLTFKIETTRNPQVAPGAPAAPKTIRVEAEVTSDQDIESREMDIAQQISEAANDLLQLKLGLPPAPIRIRNFRPGNRGNS